MVTSLTRLIPAFCAASGWHTALQARLVSDAEIFLKIWDQNLSLQSLPEFEIDSNKRDWWPRHGRPIFLPDGQIAVIALSARNPTGDKKWVRFRGLWSVSPP